MRSREQIRLVESGFKVHTDQTRFGNATRILDFYGRLTSVPFNQFLKFLNTFQQFKLVNLHIFRFYLLLKTENSRRVAESRQVCVDLYVYGTCDAENDAKFWV